jgi:hypothetical protein
MVKRYTPKYLKVKDIWEKLREIQRKYIKRLKGKSKGEGVAYVGTDMEKIIRTIKRNEGLNAGSIFEDMTNYLNGLINTYEQKQREDENKQKERTAKNPDKVNVSNVNNEIDWGKISEYPDDFETTANAFYGLGAGYGLNEDQFERFREIIDNKMYKAYDKSVADFIKKNKSIKSAEKMAEAFMEKYKNERYEIYDWL